MTKITKEQLEVLHKNAPAGITKEDLQIGYIEKGYEIEGVDTNQAKQYIQQKRAGFPAPDANRMPDTIQPKPESDGMLKALGKDVVGTLLVKPAQRATEAATRVFSPNSMAAKGYEMMADEGESQKFNVPGLGEIDAEQQKAFGQGGGRQIAGEVLKIGSYLFPYGKAASAVGGSILGASKLTPLAVNTARVGGNVASGVVGGYMADVGYNLADENKTLGESFIPGFGTALGAAIPLAGPAFKALKGKAKTGSDVTKRVIQGQTKDIPLAEQAFKNIDTKGVTTRQQLSERLGTAMDNQMNIVDDQLSKDPRALSLDDYAIRVKNNAGQEVKTDVISQSLEHLQEFYTKAGDNLSASNINLIKQKAISEGLTHQEVNNIARMYSEEFGTKAFNKVGDPLTSVNAQMFENTRNGLKQAARGGLGYGEEARAADRLYSAMNNTKRLIDNGVEKVSALDARLKDRNILQRLSYGAVKLLNAISGGTLKSGVEALGVSNVGNKIDNWIDLERSLQKDLQFIEKANGIKEESKLIKFIEDYAKKFKFPGDAAVDDINASFNKVNNLPNKQGGFVGLPQSKLPAIQRSTTDTKNIIPKTSNIPKSSPKSATKSIDLTSEAKKYKSAEDITAYHGTPEKFTSFDLSKAGKSTDSGMFGKGFYFSDNVAEAKTYSTRGGKTGEVKTVKLNMKNPYVINTKADIPDIKVPNKTMADLKNSPENYSKMFTEFLKKKGYDGVIDNLSKNKQYVVFDKSQIKIVPKK